MSANKSVPAVNSAALPKFRGKTVRVFGAVDTVSQVIRSALFELQHDHILTVASI